MQDLIFIGSGFAIVMGVLAALWSVCAAVGVVFVRVARAHADDTGTDSATQSNPPPQIPDGVPPAHVAAIAGAVSAMSPACRIVRVSAPAHVAQAWAQQGRLRQPIGARIPASRPRTQ